MAKEKRKAKGGKKNAHDKRHPGVAHIQATFNNTIVSITDSQNVISWPSAGQVGLPVRAKHRVRRTGRRRAAAQKAKSRAARSAHSRERPRLRVRHPRDSGRGPRRVAHS